MSHGFTTSPRGLSFPISLSHRLTSSNPLRINELRTSKNTEGHLLEPQTQLIHDKIQNTGNFNDILNVDLPSPENSNKLEEWQLIPDEVLLYFTGKSESFEEDDLQFFQNVARELRFCYRKLEGIKLSYKQCRNIKHISAEVHSLGSSSNSFRSEVSSFSECDLYAVKSLTYRHRSSEEEVTHDKTPTFTDSFSSISPTDLSLSSFELITSQKVSSPEADDCVPVETGPIRPPLYPQDLLLPYADNNNEQMLFSLVHDFSLNSPVNPKASEASDTDQSSKIINKQPQSLSFWTDLTDLVQYGSADTTMDPHSSDISDPVTQVTQSVSGEPELDFLNPDAQKTTELTGCSSIITDKAHHEQHKVASESLYANGSSPSHFCKNAIKEPDKPKKKRNPQGERKPNRSGVQRPQNRWWSPDEDKKDISFLKLPSVSVHSLVFHVDQHGAVKVGEGSFGSVFLADLYMNGAVYRVVVKDFSPKGVTKPCEILEEARVLMHLMDTTFIPFFYGVLHVASPQRFALVQEFFGQGLSLQNLLDDKTIHLSQASWINLCVQMAVGLDRFHRKGILLNDIKKDNVLIDCHDEEYTLKFIDMGLASYKTGRVFFGSKDYMQQFTHLAPEVRRLEKTSPASDVYSIGKILFCIAKSVPLPDIKDFVLPCLNQFPEKRPSIPAILSQLIQVRDSLCKTTSNDSTLQPGADRRWFC